MGCEGIITIQSICVFAVVLVGIVVVVIGIGIVIIIVMLHHLIYHIYY